MTRELSSSGMGRASDYKSFLLKNPRGVQWSYCIRVQGLPDTYDDGLGDWSGVWSGEGYVSRPGTLLTRDFSLGFRSDPRKPLITGDEVSFDLLDDDTGEIDKIWAPRHYGTRVRLDDDVEVTDSTVKLSGYASLSVGDYLYFGSLETMQVTTVADPVSVDRSLFESRNRKFRLVGDNTDENYFSGFYVSTSPTSFKNRIVELFCAPVSPYTSELDTDNIYPLWAGPIQEVTDVSGRISVRCAPLAALLQSSWPSKLASGKLYSETFVISTTRAIVQQNGLLMVYHDEAGNSLTVNTPLGTYDWSAPPVFSQLSVGGGINEITYPLITVIKIINDTVNNFLATTTAAPFYYAGSGNIWENKFSLSLEYLNDEQVRIVSTVEAPDTSPGPEIAYVEFPIFTIAAFGIRLRITPGMQREVTWEQGAVGNSVVLTEEDNYIPVYLDDASVIPGAGAWHAHFGVGEADVGVIRISAGDNTELISFRPDFVTVDPVESRLVYLANCNRGIGGTMPLKWGDLEEGLDNPVVRELMFASDSPHAAPGYGESLTVDQLVVSILSSAEDDENYISYPDDQGSSPSASSPGSFASRFVGYRAALAIPDRFIDYEGIYRTMRRNGAADPISAFWVEEQGKGKKDLEQLMLSYGMFFVTRQFERGGQRYFGLSVESIGSPVATTYDDEVIDADRALGSDVQSNLNERLVINSISLLPWEKVADKERSDSDPIFVYDEWSIGEYGPAKILELKPRIFDWFTELGTPSGRTYAGRQAHIAQAVFIGFKWFSSYGRGPYMIKMECPAPIGWRYDVGDHVLVTLTGVKDPEGNKNTTARAGRVYRAQHQRGSRARSYIEIYVGLDDVCELAPNGRVESISASSLTLMDGYFSVDGEHHSSNDYSDASFFDPLDYGGNIDIEVWSQGAYSGTVQSVEISARNGNVLSIDTDITLTTVATNLSGDDRPTFIGFGGYADAITARQKAYAHISDGDPPDLNGDNSKVYI